MADKRKILLASYIAVVVGIIIIAFLASKLPRICDEHIPLDQLPAKCVKEFSK